MPFISLSFLDVYVQDYSFAVTADITTSYRLGRWHGPMSSLVNLKSMLGSETMRNVTQLYGN
jgi:hypothetical protein